MEPIRDTCFMLSFPSGQFEDSRTRTAGCHVFSFPSIWKDSFFEGLTRLALGGSGLASDNVEVSNLCCSDSRKLASFTWNLHTEKGRFRTDLKTAILVQRTADSGQGRACPVSLFESTG